MAYMVQHHIKVAHISHGNILYLNLDKEMIARAPIVDNRSNFKLSQESFDRVYFDCWCDAFKIDNASVHQILLKVFTNMDAYAYIKQRKSKQDSQAVYFDIHK